MGSVIYINSNNQAGFSTANVRYFGAFGNDDQTLYPANYISDSLQTQQTADGLAINRAIVYLRSIGGGTLYIPKGIYRVWGYLESLDFNIRVVGDGVGITTLKNCDTSPTTTSGYGILRVGPPNVLVASTFLNTVSIENITFDGNGIVRTQPTGEYRSANLAIYGAPRIQLINVESINATLDCLLTDYEQTNSGGAGPHVTETSCNLKAVDCRFHNAFRNTVSCVGGWNQVYTNCDFSDGGQVHAGINPKACLDIEPNLATLTIKNLTYENCRFFNAVNHLAAMRWAGNILFKGCSFIPTVLGFSQGDYAFWADDVQVRVTSCLFQDEVTRSAYVNWNTPYYTGEYANKQQMIITDCFFDGFGLWNRSTNLVVRDTVFQNSKFPFISKDANNKSLIVTNVAMTNVIDAGNVGAGAFSGFIVDSANTGFVEIDGLDVVWRSEMVPSIPLTSAFPVYGCTIAPAPAITTYAKISNVQVSGYYQKYPVSYGLVLNPANYRDWGLNVTAPADTAGNTTTPGAIYWKNCTMYGNSP